MRRELQVIFRHPYIGKKNVYHKYIFSTVCPHLFVVKLLNFVKKSLNFKGSLF